VLPRRPGGRQPAHRSAAEPVSILRLEQIRREVGTFVILDDVTAAIAVDDRIGLVGPNGAGKTTLLRIAAGRDEAEAGTVQRKRGLTIGLLAQESHFDAAFMAAPDLRAAVRHGAAHLEAMADRLAELERSGRVEDPTYADLQHQFEILGGYTLDQRVDEALSGLGFTRDEWARPPTALSGGEQTRATLARLVIAQPDLLLLDEPTNHLDIPAREAIESFMTESPATLLVVSHDRRLLETVCTTLWVVDDGLAVPFSGGWKEWRAAVAAGWTVHEAAAREAERLGSGRQPRTASAVPAAAPGVREAHGRATAAASPPARRAAPRRERLSKDAYRRQKALVEADLSRLGLRKTQLELAMATPGIAANFVEMRRVTSELADVEQALATAEDAWLDLEERAP